MYDPSKIKHISNWEVIPYAPFHSICRAPSTLETKHWRMKAIEKVIWAMVIVFMPLDPGHPMKSWSETNKRSRDNPVITSGITNGDAIIPENNSLPLNCLILAMIKPAMVPMMVAKVAVIAAIWKLKIAASRIFSLLNSGPKPKNGWVGPHNEITFE